MVLTVNTDRPAIREVTSVSQDVEGPPVESGSPAASRGRGRDWRLKIGPCGLLSVDLECVVIILRRVVGSSVVRAAAHIRGAE